MTSTEPRADAWEVAEVAHVTTGMTMGDDATGDEWHVERHNAHFPFARVITIYAVVRTAWLDGERIDPVGLSEEDEARLTYRYAVDDQTEFLVSSTPEDFWAGTVDEMHVERGEGSYRDYDTEEEADEECRRMAEHDASLSGVVAWDGQPF